MTFSVVTCLDPIPHYRIVAADASYMTMPCAWPMERRREAMELLCAPALPRHPDWREVNVLKARAAEREKERDEARKEVAYLRASLVNIEQHRRNSLAGLSDYYGHIRTISDLALAFRKALDHRDENAAAASKLRDDLAKTMAQRDEAASEIGRLKLELHDMRNRCQAAEGALALREPQPIIATITGAEIRKRAAEISDGATKDAALPTPARAAFVEAAAKAMDAHRHRTWDPKAFAEAIADGLEARERAALAAEIAGGHG